MSKVEKLIAQVHKLKGLHERQIELLTELAEVYWIAETTGVPPAELGAVGPVVKRDRRGADYLIGIKVKIKTVWEVLPSPPDELFHQMCERNGIKRFKS